MLLSWHWCSFPQPPEWEITGFSAFDQHGDIDFHTRDGFMGRYSWRVLKKGIPDERATISAALRAQIRQIDTARAESLNDPQFLNAGIFVLGHYHESDPCIACAFIPETRVLLQWVFPQWDPGRWRETLQPMLAATVPHSGDFQDWAIFGLHITLPRDWRLTGLNPLPANVSASWENAKHRQVTMRRWGMARAVLEEFTPELLMRKTLMEQNSGIQTLVSQPVGKFPGVHAEFTRRGQFGFEKVVGRWWPGTADMWINAAENRIYCVEQLGRPSVPALELMPMVAKLLARPPENGFRK